MESYNLTMEKYKNKNIEKVLKVTFELTSSKGIQNVTFNEIATTAKIGVASIYRYFKNKDNLISECAIYYLRNIINDIMKTVNSISFKEKTAIDEFEELLNFYIKYFEKHIDFLKFLNEFDTYFTYNKMDKKIEETYNNLFLSFYEIAQKIFDKGIIDKSFKEGLDFKTIYFTVASSLLQTCIKSAVSPLIIPIDNLITTENKLKTIIELTISYCKRS